MVNKSVNEFYTRFLFKMYVLPQDVAFPLEIAATLFNNLTPYVRELLISEGFQVPPRPPIGNNNQGNQRLLLVRNVVVGSEKNIKTIKAAVKPASGGRHTNIFMVMLAGKPSTQMAGLGSSFKYEESNSMVAEEMEEYALASA